VSQEPACADGTRARSSVKAVQTVLGEPVSPWRAELTAIFNRFAMSVFLWPSAAVRTIGARTASPPGQATPRPGVQLIALVVG
jgi:hypothetical protein